IAQVIFVRLAVLEGRMTQLEIRHQLAVHVDRGANAGPEREHHLHAAAFNVAEALDVGVVAHSHRLAGHIRERLGEIEAPPAGVEVRRGAGDAVDDHAREADGHTVEGGLLPDHALQGGQDRSGRRGMGSSHLEAFTKWLRLWTDDLHLEAGPTNVDGEGLGLLTVRFDHGAWCTGMGAFGAYSPGVATTG